MYKVNDWSDFFIDLISVSVLCVCVEPFILTNIYYDYYEIELSDSSILTHLEKK